VVHVTGVYVSALDLFSIGIGPSSSHTVGPMRAALTFVTALRERGLLTRTDRIQVRLHDSLAATGIGHGTPDAVLAGLRGLEPETCDPREVHGRWADLADGGTLDVHGIPITAQDVTFEPFARDLGHPNALTFTALADGAEVHSACYLSIGGGFVVQAGGLPPTPPPVPSTYRCAADLLAACGEDGRIADVAWADEVAMHGAEAAAAGLDAIWDAMSDCVAAGVAAEGVLPGGLRVRRRAAAAQQILADRAARGERVAPEEQLAVWAMAINEENAGGGRVVTAPTNGAAGVLPAVLHYLVREHGADREQIRTFLLTAAAVGSIVKANASISGAEAGCQGEVGSACAMAAAGTTAVLGGTPRQVEIAMEHHLGLTCDPVGGLVQIPCIERNAVAAATALTASRIALLGDGQHVVSLDTVIETMRQTGADMSSRYKETSEGGLAVNVVEC
jgi:L-serine dehydratase